MAGFYRAYEPDQGGLFPVSPRDWLPEGHLAFFVSETVDQLDLRELESAYREEGKGALAYHPGMMLKVLLYAYSTGVFSSRKIARALEESVPFRYLAAGTFPNHRTICRFRERHLAAFEELFVQVVQIAGESGLVKMGTLAIDGTKVKANASKHKAMSYERMLAEEKRLRREIRDLTERSKREDRVDDEAYGPDFRGDELPEELQRRESRRKTIRAARKRLEARKAKEAAAADSAQDRAKPRSKAKSKKKPGRPRKHPPGKPKPKDQENFTDPDSRIMKTGCKGFQQSYNAQVAVEDTAQIIVAASVGQNAADVGSLIPTLDQAIENTGETPDHLLADGGYRSEDNFLELEEREIDACIPLGKEGTTKKVNPDQPATGRMQRRMQGKRGRRRYKQRKHLVEAPIGWVKQVLGFRSFSLRGLDKVRGEWSLVTTALNLRRLSTRLTWT